MSVAILKKNDNNFSSTFISFVNRGWKANAETGNVKYQL